VLFITMAGEIVLTWKRKKYEGMRCKGLKGFINNES